MGSSWAFVGHWQTMSMIKNFRHKYYQFYKYILIKSFSFLSQAIVSLIMPEEKKKRFKFIFQQIYRSSYKAKCVPFVSNY